MGLKIGLISNVNSRGQVAYKLKKYGLQDYFDTGCLLQRIWPAKTGPGHLSLRCPV